MKTKHSLMTTFLVTSLFIVSTFSAHAISGTDSIADFNAVKTHINNIQTLDTGLPSGVAEPKGKFGALISRIFTADGKIGNRFLKALGLRSNNTILKWSGGYDGELVNSSITDNGATVGIAGNLSVSGRIATSTPTANNHAATKAYVDSAIAGASGGDDLGNHTATQNLNLSGKEIDNIKHLDLKPGTGNGLRFWQSNNFKISMGNAAEYKYGPVQDYSIKSSMSNTANRGWTWGVAGQTPIMALANNGKLQLKNNLIVETGNVGIGIPIPWNKLHVNGNIGSTGWIGAGCERNCDTGGGYAMMYGDGHTVIRPSYAGYALNAKTSSASHGGVLGYSQNSGAYGILGQANAYGVYGQSNSSYGVYGRTTKNTSGGVLGYNHNATAYGILGFRDNYAFYGKGIGFFTENVIAKNPTAANHLTTKSYVDAAVSGAGGLWSENGNKVYYNGGSIGIGTNNPFEKLDILGNLKTSGIVKANGGVTVDNKLAISGNNYAHIAQSTVENHYGYFEAKDASGDRGAYFGYGNGSSKVDLYLDKASELYISGGNVNIPGKIITSTPTAGNHVATKSYVDSAVSGGGVWSKFFNTAYYSGGNVAIGTPFANEKLEVNGHITAFDPTADNHVATKRYVDSKTAGNANSQLRHDVKASRQIGNFYTNNRNYPIQVTITIKGKGSGPYGGFIYFFVSVNNSTIIKHGSEGRIDSMQSVTFMVPAHKKYYVAPLSTGVGNYVPPLNIINRSEFY